MEKDVPTTNQRHGLNAGEFVVQQVDADINVHVPEFISLSNGNGDKTDFGLTTKKKREERSFTYRMRLNQMDEKDNLKGLYAGNCKIRVEYN